METFWAVAKLIFQFIGGIVVIMSIFGYLLYLCFYRTVTLEELNEEDGYEREEEFIDRILQQ